MSRVSETDSAARVAAFGAAVIVAAQVGSKATRDTLFLSTFDIEQLPAMLIAASVFSVVTLFWASRAMARVTPQRLIPRAFGLSGSLLIGEWLLWYQAPGLTAVLLYLHVAAFGAFLISGFWSIVNERFDPRTARKKMSLIAAWATLGGLIGGLIAERVAVLFGTTMMLPLLCTTHLAAGLLVYRMRISTVPPRTSHNDSDIASWFAGLRFVRSVPYLRNIALLVLITTSSATLLDYVFKARAVAAYSGGEDLMRFFALFYAVVGLATFGLQTILGRTALERLGLSGTISLLPSITAIGSLAMFLFPGIPAGLVARGGEAAVRSSLFRSGYELLYTPVPVREKRAAKPIVDVGFDRLADGFGAILVFLCLLLASTAALSAMLVGAVALAAMALFVAGRLKQGYIDSLKLRLVDRADELKIEPSVAADSSVMRTLGSLDLNRLLKQGSTPRHGRAAKRQEPSRIPDRGSIGTDRVMEAMADLRSGDPERVRVALGHGIDPFVSRQAISLLSWDEVSQDAVRALRKVSDKIVGELTDALLDPSSVFALRRRIPRVLSKCESPRAVSALLLGLEDNRFEVRFQCAAALGEIHDRRPEIDVPFQQIKMTVARELEVDPAAWAGRKLLDQDSSLALDRLAGERVNLSLKHVFTLLSLFYEKEPLEIALKGLYTDDPQLRGTALEYLESVLPPEIQKGLWPFLESRPPLRRAATRSQDAHAALLQSKQSIETNLANLGKKR